MDREFTFYDYIDADGSGVNVIKAWLDSQGKPAKAHFTMIIPHLEASPPQGKQGSAWRFPNIKQMKDAWDGFTEFRKEARKVQYRLLGQMRDRDVLLVACGIHKGQHYDTDVTASIARNRVAQMISSPAKYRREHEY
jgi:hypothetical protein